MIQLNRKRVGDPTKRSTIAQCQIVIFSLLCFTNVESPAILLAIKMARVNEIYEAEDDDNLGIINEAYEENNYLLPDPIIIGADGNSTM